MNYGILNEEVSRQLFEEINKRLHCERCQSDRASFSIQDKKHKNCYSNLLPGFSSEEFSIPIDILIVAEAHGGGREDSFRPQADLGTEVAGLGDYYLQMPLQKFHQKEMRKLLTILTQNGKTWVFTDLIKCFVWQGRDDTRKLKGSDSKDTAIRHRRKYLDKQIVSLRPQKVLSLGNTVADQYFRLQDHFSHGSVHKCRVDDHSFDLVFCIFPSRNTADLWVQYGEWEQIILKLI